MGIWNAKIVGNDSAMDVYGFFEKLYNKQELDIEQIKTKTLSEFNLLNDQNEPVFGNEEWLAYALICWECRALDEQTRTIVNRILDNKETIEEEWEDLTEKRIAAIQNFLIKIQTPSQRKKQIKKEYIVNISFQEGDCIAVRYGNKMYSAFIVIDIDKKNIDEPNMWTYFMGATRIYSETKPSMEDILNSYFLVVNYGRTFGGEKAYWMQKPELLIRGNLIGNVKSEKEKLEREEQLKGYEIIGNIQLTSKPAYQKSYGGFHLNDECQIRSQFEWEKFNPQSINLLYPIKRYTANKKGSWKFWK